VPISMIRHGLCHPCFRRSTAASPTGGAAANNFERADHPVDCGHTPQGMGSSRDGTAPASMAVRRPTIGCPGLSARAPPARRLELLGTVQRSHADPPSVYRYITGSSTRFFYRPPRAALRQGHESVFIFPRCLSRPRCHVLLARPPEQATGLACPPPRTSFSQLRRLTRAWQWRGKLRGEPLTRTGGEALSPRVRARAVDPPDAYLPQRGRGFPPSRRHAF